MRLARGPIPGATGRAGSSPYRVAGEPCTKDDPRGRWTGEACALLFVLACSLLRFAIFAFRTEHFGLNPGLALAASVASAYSLYRLNAPVR